MRASTQASDLGKTLFPGLPDLTGQISVGTSNRGVQLIESATATGVFTLDYTTKYWGIEENVSANLPYAMNFKASKSNEIYGNANSVIPGSVWQPAIIYLGK